jgi:hypothetical protein
MCESSFAVIHEMNHRNMLPSKDLRRLNRRKTIGMNHESDRPGESRMCVSRFASIHAGVSPQNVPIKGLKDVDSPKRASENLYQHRPSTNY